MNYIHASILTAALFLAAMSSASAAAFEDAAAGFAFDLPDGYSEKSRQNAMGTTLLTFKVDGGPDIVVSAISIEAGFDDNEEIFEMQMEPIEEVFGGATTTIELSDLEIGGMPARWGWMEGTTDSSLDMVAGVGAIELGDVQIAFSAAMPKSQFADWQSVVETSFFSIRERGETAGTVSNKVAVQRSVEEAVVIEPSTYRHPLFAVDLPAGWQATTISTEPKAINMASLAGPTGSSITVLCMSGFLANKKTMEEVMYGSLSQNLPTLNHVGGNKIKARNGKKSEIKMYKARTEAKGDTVVLDGITASLKNGKCMLGFIGISPETPNDQRVAEVVGIVQSVH
jgi:hypothetical protein